MLKTPAPCNCKASFFYFSRSEAKKKVIRIGIHHRHKARSVIAMLEAGMAMSQSDTLNALFQ